MNKLLLLLTFFFLSHLACGQSFVFAQLTGSPVNTTGWNLTGNAYVGNTPVGGGNSEVILTNPANSQSGGVFFTSPINIVQCDKWTVEFEFRIWDGNAADGLAFCLLDVPPAGFVGGGGCGIPASSNGLKIVFDTYNNCGAANPAIQIRYGTGYAGGECNYAQPTLDNGGQLNFIRSNTYNQARIEYDAGSIEVYVNNTLYLSGFYVINFTTYAGFTASTGAVNDRHSIRNVTIKTEIAQPDAYAGANAFTCANQPIQIGSAPVANYQYQWTPTTGLDNSTIANPTLTLPNAGTTPLTVMYKVGANIIGSPGCKRYDSVYVTVYPIPNATFTINAPQYCVNQTATVTYTGFASLGATYNWNFGGGTVISGSGQGPYQISWGTSGTKTISLTVTENNCPSPPVNLQVPVYDYPTSAFTMPLAACQNAPVNVQYTGTGTPAATYNWSFGGGIIGSGTGQGPYSISWPNAGSTNVTLTVTENGCTSTLTQNSITINTIPTAAFQVVTSVCDGASSAITYTGTGTTNATYNWNWDSGNAVASGGNQNYTVTWPTTGIKNITLTVTENGCPSPVVTHPVTVYAIPTSTFTLTPNVCAAANAQAAYTGTGSPAATYTWGFGTGTATTTGTETYDVVWANAGLQNVTLTVTENGCTSTLTQQSITVYPIPTSTFTAQSPLCDGQTSAVVYTGTGTANGAYNWNFNGGNTVQGAGQNYAVTWPTTGTKNITLTVTENGCSSTQTTVPVIIYPIPLANFTATSSICLLDKAQVGITNPFSPTATYNWDFDTGIAAPTGNEQYDVTWPQQGQYTIILTVSDNGCTSQPFTQNITVNYQPTATFTGNAIVCVNDDLAISYTGNGLSSATYSWTITGGGNLTGAGQGPLTANWSNSGQFDISLTVSENGCTSTFDKTIQVAPLPVTLLAPAYNICLGENLVLDPGAFNQYNWGTGLQERTMNVELAGSYTVTVTDLNGCVNTFNTTVFDTVCISLYIPNAFTPNGDSNNEVFKPIISYPLTYTIRLYNRWGQLLYTSVNDVDANWDGTLNGKECPPEVYIYYIDYSGYVDQHIVKGIKKGTVTLIR